MRRRWSAGARSSLSCPRRSMTPRRALVALFSLWARAESERHAWPPPPPSARQSGDGAWRSDARIRWKPEFRTRSSQMHFCRSSGHSSPRRSPSCLEGGQPSWAMCFQISGDLRTVSGRRLAPLRRRSRRACCGTSLSFCAGSQRSSPSSSCSRIFSGLTRRRSSCCISWHGRSRARK